MSINEFKNIKILFVEDEDSIRDNAISYLKRIFDEVYGANDAYEAFDIIQNRKPHIIITDINLPKINGLEMIKKIRQSDSSIKIIILSAYTNTEYLLDAVELGLEKYLVKPICHDILFTVLSSCVKKIKSIDENIKYFSKDCYFDVINKSLYKEGNIIKLSNKELKFLTLLCEYSNRFVSYETIEYIVWNGDFMSEDALRTLARKIRKKIPKDCLENFSKVGYKIITL
ncbi:response regulator transcription factor [Aliarcobacter skirrowii]|uniref:response regulator transcription factor n=2 Tax=Aliarcobacter skirrowii TaxID=28200 RepID=UPI0029AEBD5D|nr:response regulator transcription factor [Aliarcobacter skirrowii]MDX4028651.1 response regulator transcription factor [Aliarcobacter skirrowii]MDY0181550.1 response regulator transcription factor [Aliarcobacter skirrowii]